MKIQLFDHSCSLIGYFIKNIFLNSQSLKLFLILFPFMLQLSIWQMGLYCLMLSLIYLVNILLHGDSSLWTSINVVLDWPTSSFLLGIFEPFLHPTTFLSSSSLFETNMVCGCSVIFSSCLLQLIWMIFHMMVCSIFLEHLLSKIHIFLNYRMVTTSPVTL